MPAWCSAQSSGPCPTEPAWPEPVWLTPSRARAFSHPKSLKAQGKSIKLPVLTGSLLRVFSCSAVQRVARLQSPIDSGSFQMPALQQALDHVFRVEREAAICQKLAFPG